MRTWKTKPSSFPAAAPSPRLVSGEVDYSGAGGTGMRAALRGAPIKAVMFQTEKVTWYLIAAPEIAKAADLKGKRVAVGTVGDTQDALITAYAERNGVGAARSDPRRHAVALDHHDHFGTEVGRDPAPPR